MLGLKLFHCYRTTFLPTGGLYFGIHETSDMSFGTGEYKDPFVGSGRAIKALVQAGAKRGHFKVDSLCIGTYDNCKAFYDRIVFDYNHPLCLNDKPGAPAGVPKTAEHKANISDTLSVVMVDNDNALGNKGNDNPIKFKKFHKGNDIKRLETVDGKTPADPAYKDWKLGTPGSMTKAEKVSERMNNPALNPGETALTAAELALEAEKTAPKTKRPTVSTTDLGL